MLTAEDIRNVTFTKSMGGYKTGEVDVFLDQCADTLDALMKEKTEMTHKLEVLADKLVEYRNEEDSIRTALLSAQRLGDTVVRESNHKAGLILEDANIKAENMLENARRNIQSEEQELVRIQQEVKKFKSRLLSIYREHLSLIDLLPAEETSTAKSNPDAETQKESASEEQTAEPQAAAVEQPTAQPEVPQVQVETITEPAIETPTGAAAEINASPLTEPEADAKPRFTLQIEELDEEAASPETQAAPARPASRFADLKFGEEYDISKDTDEEQKGFFKHRK